MIRLDEVRAVYRQALAAVKNHSAELLVKLPFHGKFGFYAGGRVREPTNRFDFRVGVQLILLVAARLILQNISEVFYVAEILLIIDAMPFKASNPDRFVVLPLNLPIGGLIRVELVIARQYVMVASIFVGWAPPTILFRCSD